MKSSKPPFSAAFRSHLGRHDLFDEMGRNLGIGLAAELVTRALKLAPENVVVLDDPVVHQRQTVAAVAMGMRVGVRGRAVRRPPSVSDARGAL
jgi:hypothetical protein